MIIQRFSECPELSAIRSTLFYLQLRPYVYERLADKLGSICDYLDENSEKTLVVNDRYFFTLDILLGELFKNIKTRQFWKSCLSDLQQKEEVSCLSIESLDKAYHNELVVFFERLGRILVLVENAFKDEVKIEGLKKYLLRFFNPLLFEKRNYAHHRMYLGFPGMFELKTLEENVHDQESFDIYYENFQKTILDRVSWIDYTEQEMTVFIAKFLDFVHAKIFCNGMYKEPKSLPSNFSCSDKLNVDFRDRLKHSCVFEDA